MSKNLSNTREKRKYSRENSLRETRINLKEMRNLKCQKLK